MQKKPNKDQSENLSDDLSPLFARWPFVPGQPNVRQFLGDDGEGRIQIRLDLGILQMFADGRPDGERPHEHESLLEYYEAAMEDSAEQPEAERLKLSSDECSAIRDEALQYYHRYMALLVLEDFDGVVRDTTRNLRVFDLCRDHAETEEDRQALEQYRPYVLMVRTRALASQMIKDGEASAAMFAIDQGIDLVRRAYADLGDPAGLEQSQEVQMLRQMRDSLAPKLPVKEPAPKTAKGRKAELKQQLEEAIAKEDYEEAARLRDEIKKLKE
ncbi:MAG: hypothetical protein HEQ23_08805 [Tepidisphaera sp.]